MGENYIINIKPETEEFGCDGCIAQHNDLLCGKFGPCEGVIYVAQEIIPA